MRTEQASLGVDARFTPSCVGTGGSTSKCFYENTDGKLWSAKWNGSSWSSPTNLGSGQNGTLVGPTECVSWGPGRADCFGRTIGNEIRHWYHGSGARAWGATTYPAIPD